ncbi:MAG: FAD:protein FMN transferase [Clostridia bacterium]|nr:FAD:protein FMN transferase [Clostridia bacterium]
MKKIITACLAALLVLTLFGCGAGASYEDRTIYGMDTYITLRLSDDSVSDAYVDEVADGCAAIIAKNEKLMSSHDEDAVIYGFNHGADVVENPDSSLVSVLRTAKNLAELTDGAFSPTLGALTELWNVTGGGPVQKDEDVKKALEHVDLSSLTVADEKLSKTDREVKIDLGGIAKGYTAQEILEYLVKTDVKYGAVSMGGNVGVFGEKPDGTPFKIGVTDPRNREDVVGYLSVDNGFVAVSGDYERYFEENGKRYHHIIDPATGAPADSGLASAAVWANSGSAADALSTALFVMGEEKALELYRSGRIRFEAILITTDGKVTVTDGIGEDFELTSDDYVMKNQEAEN